MILTELIDEAGFPPGVFNLVNGDGATTGDALETQANLVMHQQECLWKKVCMTRRLKE